MDAQDDGIRRDTAVPHATVAPDFAGLLAGLHRELDRPLRYVRGRMCEAITARPWEAEHHEQLRTMVELCDELARDMEGSLLGRGPGLSDTADA